jgi:hypothetical protein
VNKLGENADSVKRNTRTLLDTSKKVDLEANTEKTESMLESYQQNEAQIHDMKIANRSFENVAQFKYLGMRVTDQNLI